jgi:hypothetical protein
MKKSRQFWLPLVASLVLTPICLLLGIASGGVGHGDYVLARILFPYTMLSALLFDVISAPFILLAVLQFPLYGFALGKAAERKRFLLVFLILLAAHALAAAACFIPFNESFQ